VDIGVWQAEAVTLTVAESFQIAKDIVEKETSSSLSSVEHPTTSATAVQQVCDVCRVTQLDQSGGHVSE